jgi:hypothetical protein
MDAAVAGLYGPLRARVLQTVRASCPKMRDVGREKSSGDVHRPVFQRRDADRPNADVDEGVLAPDGTDGCHCFGGKTHILELL